MLSVARRVNKLSLISKRLYSFVPKARSHVDQHLESLVAQKNIVTLPPGVSVLDHVKEQYASINGARSFHTFDMGAVEHRFAKWHGMLPRVDPWFAVKCNPDEVLVKTLFAHGSGFDCASMAEIQHCLDIGCSPDRIIFANPAKLPSDIEFAAKVGVTKMTFDSEDELHKIKDAFSRVENAPVPEPIVRIITDDSHSVCKFSAKFGAPVEDAEHLLAVAKELGMAVVGCSFHVGSGCASTHSFTKAIQDCHKVFLAGQAEGHPMHMLDLGGGFPADDHARIPFSHMAAAIRAETDKLFPPNFNDNKVASLTGAAIPPLHIIAEPGRYFAANTMNYVSPIIARRLNYKLPSWANKNGEANREPHILAYVCDGLYGAFCGILQDHYVPSPPLPILADKTKQEEHEANVREYLATGQAQEEVSTVDGTRTVQGNLKNHVYVKGTFRTKVFGPTCDGLDCILQETPLPEVSVGDWLVFPEMGAYSTAAQSSFNGIERSPVMYFRTSKENYDYNF